MFRTWKSLWIKTKWVNVNVWTNSIWSQFREEYQQAEPHKKLQTVSDNSTKNRSTLTAIRVVILSLEEAIEGNMSCVTLDSPWLLTPSKISVIIGSFSQLLLTLNKFLWDVGVIRIGLGTWDQLSFRNMGFFFIIFFLSGALRSFCCQLWAQTQFRTDESQMKICRSSSLLFSGCKGAYGKIFVYLNRMRLFKDFPFVLGGRTRAVWETKVLLQFFRSGSKLFVLMKAWRLRASDKP